MVVVVGCVCLMIFLMGFDRWHGGGFCGCGGSCWPVGFARI